MNKYAVYEVGYPDRTRTITAFGPDDAATDAAQIDFDDWGWKDPNSWPLDYIVIGDCGAWKVTVVFDPSFLAHEATPIPLEELKDV